MRDTVTLTSNSNCSFAFTLRLPQNRQGGFGCNVSKIIESQNNNDLSYFNTGGNIAYKIRKREKINSVT